MTNSLRYLADRAALKDLVQCPHVSIKKVALHEGVEESFLRVKFRDFVDDRDSGRKQTYSTDLCFSSVNDAQNARLALRRSHGGRHEEAFHYLPS